jgi:hypothetical protein
MQLLRNKITVGILIASQFMYGMPVSAEHHTSEPSPQVQGRAPVASNLVFDKPSPALGDTVTLTYDFSDLDGDLEQGTTVQWLRNGQPIPGATSFTYTPDETQGDRAAQLLTAEVTPMTNPSSSDPAVGLPVSLQATVAGDAMAPPQVKVTDITGSLTVGSTLTGVYDYQDGGSGSKDASIKSWLSADGSDKGNDGTYRLANDDAGHVLTFQVQAMNVQGTVGNTEHVTTATATNVTGGDINQPGVVIDATAKPFISNLTISGVLNKDADLSTTYTFDANKGDSSDKSLFAWGIQGTTGAVVSKGSAVSTSGKLPDYKILDKDVGQVLEVSVQPKNGLSVTGTTVTTTAKAGGATDLDINQPGVVIDAAATPFISNLSISGVLKVGEILSASYLFDPKTGVSGDASTFVWAHTATTAADVITSGIALTSEGKVREYTIDSVDAGKVLELSVQAKNKAGVTGNIETVKTVEVKGLVPVATNVTITSSNTNGTPFSGGQTLTGSYTYSHPQDDIEGTSTFIWERNGTSIAGATQKTYKLNQQLDVGKTITFGVTPVSYASTNNTGLRVMSDPTAQIKSVLAPFFLPVGPLITRKYADAIQACEKEGGTLPSRSELQSLFVRATSATVANGSQSNTDMCDIYGWPLAGQCGGGSSYYSNYYWSSTPYGGKHFNVLLDNGGANSSSDDNSLLQVACVR